MGNGNGNGSLTWGWKAISVVMGILAVVLGVILVKQYELGENRPTRQELIDADRDHMQKDEQRFSQLEGQLKTITQIQAERREQILGVERQVSALDKVVAGHEILIRQNEKLWTENERRWAEFRAEFRQRVSEIELLIRQNAAALAHHANEKPREGSSVPKAP